MTVFETKYPNEARFLKEYFGIPYYWNVFVNGTDEIVFIFENEDNLPTKRRKISSIEITPALTNYQPRQSEEELKKYYQSI